MEAIAQLLFPWHQIHLLLHLLPVGLPLGRLNQREQSYSDVAHELYTATPIIALCD